MFPLLETLVAVYEVGQFTLAADELKVSQSTVSSRIAQLEQMVGAPLFVRNAKSDVTPTQAGLVVGQVEGVFTDPSGMTRYAVVLPDVKLDSLVEVFVIKDFDIVE